ncbi:MAG TPA: HisA/HisF-related TIM barrel protein [Longimicrobiales bacterium]|nr:HisA/HisF-related TIM barrel protein [Longimicrobiales bacterium]
MIALPALDLSGGAAVQWVGGRPNEERVRLPSPGETARAFHERGFDWLHLVDLDAALGKGDQIRDVDDILAHAPRGRVQVGGGIRNDDRVGALLDLGAERVVIGTRAARDAGWLTALARRRPGRVVVAADVRGERVTTEGWTADAGVDVDVFLARLQPLPIGGVLVTDVQREGRMGGADIERFRRLAAGCRHPLLAAGGIRDLDDLRRLRDAGAAGAVVGMAIYTGAIDPDALAREFGRDDGSLGRDDPSTGVTA